MDHIDVEDQENIAPNAAATPVKPLVDLEDSAPQSAFRVSPEKKYGLKERTSPMKTLPVKNLMDDFDDAALKISSDDQHTPKRDISSAKETPIERSAQDNTYTSTPNICYAIKTTGVFSPRASPS